MNKPSYSPEHSPHADPSKPGWEGTLFTGEEPWVEEHQAAFDDFHRYEEELEGRRKKYEAATADSGRSDRELASRPPIEQYIRMTVEERGEATKPYIDPLGLARNQYAFEFDTAAEFDPNNCEIQGIVFDWDNNLKHTGLAWLEAHSEYLAEHGVNLSAKEILSFFGDTEFAKKLGLEHFQEDGRQLDEHEVFDRIAALAAQKLAEKRVDPAVVKVLKKLHKQGIKLSVFSSSPRELLNDGIAADGLTEVFDASISADDVTKRKPDPEGLNKALEAMGVDPGHALMVGDSWNDVRAGKAAGTHTLKTVHPLDADIQAEKEFDQKSAVRVYLDALREGAGRQEAERRLQDARKRNRQLYEEPTKRAYFTPETGIDAHGFFGRPPFDEERSPEEVWDRMTEMPDNSELVDVLSDLKGLEHWIVVEQRGKVSDQYRVLNHGLSYRSRWHNELHERKHPEWYKAHELGSAAVRPKKKRN